MSSQMPVIAVKPSGAKRLAQGRPWVFSNDIEMSAEAKALERGTLVSLKSGAEWLGTAMYNPHTLISARLLTPDADVVVDAGFLRERLQAALFLRERLFDAPYYRLVHAEGDGLPGLVIDRYGDVLSVQANTAGMDRLMPEILTALDDVLDPSVVVVRADTPARAQEGLEPVLEVAKGALSGPVGLMENGVQFRADLGEGQKTGWFYDHRLNRAFIAGLCEGQRVLDLYTHTGAFALTCAAAGAASVSGIDRSASAIALAEEAAKENDFSGEVSFRKSDVFAALEHFAKAGETFDVVIADPPAFVKSRKDLQAGLKGYRKLARLAGGAVAPGGILLAASCSHLVEESALLGQIARGLSECGRSARILHRGGAGPDHPIHPQLPETAYLKAFVLALD